MADPHNASEAAQLIADLVADKRVVSDEAAQDLRRLVSHSLAAPSTAALRDARLGLLIDLVIASGGGYVDVDRYDQARAERRARGEQWPDRSSLSRAYGHWLAAVSAASRFWFDGGHARVPSLGAHHRFQPAYDPQEIVLAIIRLRHELGAPGSPTEDAPWPSEWEYHEWGRLRRRGASRSGHKERIPGPQQIRKAYGSFDRPLAAAQRVHEQNQTRSSGAEAT